MHLVIVDTFPLSRQRHLSTTLRADDAEQYGAEKRPKLHIVLRFVRSINNRGAKECCE